MNENGRKKKKKRIQQSQFGDFNHSFPFVKIWHNDNRIENPGKTGISELAISSEENLSSTDIAIKQNILIYC